uniref:Synaptobrevin, longin-like domain protein n=1 Tax=Tanacetum cinerariifolium TaxID=118510 RepID=A0A6L2M6L1_TANCI|nr:hypothetical protein [Tanacetum cinerariifolium]
MIAILEKSEHNIDFHQIVDFIKASHTRIATKNEGTEILATVDGKPMTISESLIRRNLKLNDEEGISSLPDVELFENLALMGYNILPNQIFTFQKDKHASLLRDDNQGEAFPTVTSLDAGYDKENIIKTSALPHDSTPRVTSLDADEGSMKQQLQELMALCTGLQRQQTEMASKIKAQDLEISSLKARIKLLKDKDRGNAEPTGDDDLIKGRSMEIKEEVKVERNTERGSNDTEEMVNLLTSIEAANILTSRVTAVSVSPVAGVLTVGVHTVSRLVPTVSAIFTTASVIAIDAKIARIHAEEELKMMIDGLDRNNEVIARHLQEYEQSKAELTIGEKIDLINELVKYQDHHEKILKYQAQQSKPLCKKEQREFYMSILRSHAGWKTKHFRCMKLEEIRAKFIPASAKMMRTSEEIFEEDLKDMMQLVLVEEQLWALVKETLSMRQASSDKEMELWVELKRLFETDFEDQLWTHTQNLMHDPLDWKLYNTCGVHHVFTKDQEIFMLVERDYPLRRGLAIVMICNKIQVENYS